MRDFSETHVNAGGPSMVPYVSLLWRSLLSDVTEKLSKSFERTQPIFSRVCAVCFAVWEAAPAPELSANTNMTKMDIAVIVTLAVMMLVMLLFWAMPRLAEGERQSMPYKILHPISSPPTANGGVTQTTTLTHDQSKSVTAGLEHSVPASVSKTHPTNKQSKSARRRAAHRAAKADETKDIEAAGQWQKVQHRSKTFAKGGASKTPTTTTPLMSAKGQGASQSNQPNNSMPTTAETQSLAAVPNFWTISARTPMPAPAEHVNGYHIAVKAKVHKAKAPSKTWAALPKESLTSLAAAPLAEEWPALNMA